MIWNPWKEIKRLEEKLAIQVDQTNFWCDATMSCLDKLDAARQTLFAIAAMETPRCSNVVRKITRMAREAIEKCTTSF
jgi:hypothetical protein